MNAVVEPRLAFRPMQRADLDTIMEIEPTIYPYPWTRGNFADSIKAGYSCWIAEHEGAIVGYAVMMMALDEAHLLNISIAQEYQGRGWGRYLLEHVIEVARRYRGQMMFLEVRPSNRPAMRLYERMGFNEFSVRKGYYPAANGREDAILMGLAL